MSHSHQMRELPNKPVNLAGDPTDTTVKLSWE